MVGRFVRYFLLLISLSSLFSTESLAAKAWMIEYAENEGVWEPTLMFADPLTGDTKLIGPLQIGWSMARPSYPYTDLEMAPTGELYLICQRCDKSSAPNLLYKINTVTGQATLVGQLYSEGYVGHMVWDGYGKLWVSVYLGGQTKLYEYDLGSMRILQGTEIPVSVTAMVKWRNELLIIGGRDYKNILYRFDPISRNFSEIRELSEVTDWGRVRDASFAPDGRFGLRYDAYGTCIGGYCNTYPQYYLAKDPWEVNEFTLMVDYDEENFSSYFFGFGLFVFPPPTPNSIPTLSRFALIFLVLHILSGAYFAARKRWPCGVIR